MMRARVYLLPSGWAWDVDVDQRQSAHDFGFKTAAFAADAARRFIGRATDHTNGSDR